MAVDEKNVINGKFGRVIVNGYEMFAVEEASLEIKIDREVIRGTGLRAAIKYYKMKDFEVSGKFKVKKVDNMGMREYLDALKSGSDPEVLIEMATSDPAQYNGQEEHISFMAQLEGTLKLMEWQNMNPVDQEYSFQVNPASIDWPSVIDGERQDIFVKEM